ncbi:MAG: hypothetical protein HXY49_12645 [Ignavibacteriaceae bacterium]|nr:hypothetical protein [Ignavibacteriaceae bacterium]
MHILQLEQERTALKEKLVGGFSNQAKLIFIYHFFEKTLSTKNKNLIDSYLPEFLPDYLFYLKNYSVYGLPPAVTEQIIPQAEKTEMSDLAKEYQKFPELMSKLKGDVEKLRKILNGEPIETVEQKAFFPLLDEEAIKETGMTIGVLESVTIKIYRAKSESKFIIVPSEKEIEEKISEHIKLSWLIAVSIAKKYIKRIHPHHEVIISFDKRAGFCKGNSLGTALTLSFIEELLKTYNSPIVIKVGDAIAFTGGMNEQEKVTNTSEEIIKQKTELVFFTDILHLAVPKAEETAAIEKLNELKREYPNRDLRAVGIEDLNDLLNRRNLVEIKKINPAIRSARFARKNWAALSVILLFASSISFFILRDIDTNPHSFSADGNKLYIKNKSGKVLWAKDVSIPKHLTESPNFLMSAAKIVDINSDGMNEVVLCRERKTNSGDSLDYSGVRCYNYAGDIIWQYSFGDKIFSERGELNTDYGLIILDTLTINGEKSLFLISSNKTSFSSAIYRINIKNGERLPGTFWCSGHVLSGIIKDVDIDGKAEILAIGYDNGYEDVVFFAYKADTLTKVRPTTENYLIRNFKVSEMKAYLRFPKTDFDNYYAVRTPLIFTSDFSDDEKGEQYHFSVANVRNYSDAALSYEISYGFKDIDVIVDSDFRVQRDTLVAHGELKPPYTDTDEYIDLIKNKILYWKNGKWVKREEIE